MLAPSCSKRVCACAARNVTLGRNDGRRSYQRRLLCSLQSSLFLLRWNALGVCNKCGKMQSLIVRRNSIRWSDRNLVDLFHGGIFSPPSFAIILTALSLSLSYWPKTPPSRLMSVRCIKFRHFFPSQPLCRLWKNSSANNSGQHANGCNCPTDHLYSIC